MAVQVESPAAVDHAEAIAAVPGVDVIFLGPADFSILSGIPGDFDNPKIQAAIEKIAKAAKNTGKHWGLPVGNAARGKQLMDLGARLICCGADIIHVKTALETIQKNFVPLGFKFNNQLADAGSYLQKA